MNKQIGRGYVVIKVLFSTVESSLSDVSSGEMIFNEAVSRHWASQVKPSEHRVTLLITELVYLV